jgi:pyrroline-5-carboxylate reductase
MAKVWRARTGEEPLVWSRGGQSPAGVEEKRIDGGAWVSDWADALRARSVVVALPGRVLLDLAEGSERARTFEGTILSAASSLSRESLQRAFPRATAICIAPFLIDGAHSIPVAALRPAGLSDPDWEKAASELYRFGEVDVVVDEESFARIFLLGASWPTVVLAALQAAADVGVRGLQDEAAALGRRLFFKALRSLLSEQTADTPGDAVATPGGITERGLKNIGELSSLLESVFEQMRARADELRA